MVHGEHEKVENGRDRQDVGREIVLRGDLVLRPIKDHSEKERNDPEYQASWIEHLPQCCAIIVEITIQAGSHLESCGYQEPSNTPNTADEDMSRDKTNYVSKATSSHEEEN